MREECSSVIDATEKSLGMVESLKAFQSHQTLTLAEKRLPLFYLKTAWGLISYLWAPFCGYRTSECCFLWALKI